jgi:hypothetical protein
VSHLPLCHVLKIDFPFLHIFILFIFCRGHNVTFLNGFPPDFSIDGLHEITPAGLVNYIQNYTNWDLLGARMRGDLPLGVWDVLRYGFEVYKIFQNAK